MPINVTIDADEPSHRPLTHPGRPALSAPPTTPFSQSVTGYAAHCVS
jgi:hypothetical protein